MNFKIAFDRITTAYLNNQLNPYIGCACFIGNLLNGKNQWEYIRDIKGNNFGIDLNPTVVDEALLCIKTEADGFYNPTELCELERQFLLTISRQLGIKNDKIYSSMIEIPESLAFIEKETIQGYEDALYAAMVSTLDKLKELHISKGEDVDQSLALTKRVLQAT